MELDENFNCMKFEPEDTFEIKYDISYFTFLLAFLKPIPNWAPLFHIFHADPQVA